MMAQMAGGEALAWILKAAGVDVLTHPEDSDSERILPWWSYP